jgi:hypothetical protein
MRQIYILTIILFLNYLNVSAQTTSDVAYQDNTSRISLKDKNVSPNANSAVSISGSSKVIANSNRNIYINISPNPSSSFIQISGLQNTEYYRIYNILGKEIAKGFISDNETINIQNLKNGLYLLKVNNMHAKKFLKE